LNEGNTAKDVLEKVLAAENGKLKIGDNEVTSRVVEGEEEAQFWKVANEKRAAQKNTTVMLAENAVDEVNADDMVHINENVIRVSFIYSKKFFLRFCLV
jgi:hypothetical protein